MKTAILTLRVIRESTSTFYILAGGILFFAFFYMYCINSAVRFAVARHGAMSRISTLQDSVSELESKYMASANNITLESARGSGFVDPKVKDFISRNSSGKPLSMNK